MLTPKTMTSILFTLLLTAAHLTAATPISSPTQQDKQTRSQHNAHDRRGDTPDLSCLTLPTVAGAATPLPTIPTGYKLKHVALGVGTQNYTCSSDSADAVAVTSPSSAGALASLWDIGPFLASPLGHLFENALPPLALAMYGALSSNEGESWWDAVIAQMPWIPSASGDTAANTLPSTAFGEHFFSSTLTPTWDLLPSAAMYPDEAASIVFQGKKEGSLDAPRDACPGLNGEGAVPWLYLTKSSTTDDGIAAVYRVITAGGMQPDTCEGLAGQEIEVKYAAEYWFYGP
ncbi:uncharacterized protein BKCO1_20000111 [Diplodia corticola]|uniref:Conserved fungal protein n=1 Tax=Diplodia corticola TaxID=236234 RepID=A0A1J9RQT8_9PEZI|nr:uncharacterized protein BKCO1_20000111 [Diplodia corticola]OJD34891.1 conserved fungal protein [Diplodia corticola]